MGILSDLVSQVIEECSPKRVETESLPIGTDTVHVSWDEIPVGSYYTKIERR